LPRLTSFAACGGCASKLAAGELARALGVLPLAADARVLVDYRTSDDAGVYRLEGERAIVQTVDFFTPIVDDPFTYGQIAAANAMSDVYAMGGRPLTALAIAAFSKEVEREVINAIFSGGIAMLQRAGVALLGGHTVQDPEIKFGYAVTGEVNPDRMWTNGGARPGDQIVLTKPLGTGVVTTAIKFDRAPDTLAQQAIASMLTLNKTAAEVLQTLEADAVHACTDVTGFGLAGHGSEMAEASGVTIELDAARLPLFEGVLSMATGNQPGGGRTNAHHFGDGEEIDPRIPPEVVQLLHDPQTSGGLLIALAPAALPVAQQRLTDAGCGAWHIGSVAARRSARIVVR
jgi:selenide,water dikinase